MRVFRLAKTIYTDTLLSGEGGLVADGRWHSVGRPIVYTATCEALAVLELRVHLGRHLPKTPFAMHVIEIPDRLVERIEASTLDPQWRALPWGRASQAIGDDWQREGRSLALAVPSIHSASDGNVLINPAHGDIGRVKVLEVRRYGFDRRLFGA